MEGAVSSSTLATNSKRPETMQKALGTIIRTIRREPTTDEIHCGLFDYYDHWTEQDARLGGHCAPLSQTAEVFANDLVNLSVYAGQILHQLKPENIVQAPSVVVVGALTEAYITAARSACDGLGIALSYIAAEKNGQAPDDSLRSLIMWAQKNPNRIAETVRPLLDYDFSWFWELRSIRDQLIHKGARATIACDGKQFYLWLHSPERGWIMRESLIPRLAQTTRCLADFADFVSELAQRRVPLPSDRHRTRMLHGVTIHSLHQLLEVASNFTKPSP